MDTYVTDSNRRTNHSMMLIHSCLSWAVVIPATTGELCLLCWPAQLLAEQRNEKLGSLPSDNATQNHPEVVTVLMHSPACCVWL